MPTRPLIISQFIKNNVVIPSLSILLRLLLVQPHPWGVLLQVRWLTRLQEEIGSLLCSWNHFEMTFCLVTWRGVILLDAAESWPLKGCTWSAAILELAAMFQVWLIGIKGPEECQDNIPHTITPAAAAAAVWAVDIRQVGSVDSCSWCQTVTPPSVMFLTTSSL